MFPVLSLVRNRCTLRFWQLGYFRRFLPSTMKTCDRFSMLVIAAFFFAPVASMHESVIPLSSEFDSDNETFLTNNT